MIADLIQDKLSIEPGAFEGSCSQYTPDDGNAVQLNTLERTKLFMNFLALSNSWFWKTSWWHSSQASSLTFPGK